MDEFIPQIKPWIDTSDLDQVVKVINSTYVTENMATLAFEEEIKALTGSKFAISMSNGTVASFVALKSLGIGQGDEVIVPNITFIATATAVIMAGAMPVLCDVDPDFFCLDVKLASKLVTKNTKAIMPVHLYGQPANINEVLDIARENNLFVVEDAAQGVGVHLRDKHVGTFGDVGILSFYGNKTITTAEGGILLTDCSEIAKTAFRLKNHGRSEKGTFIHETIGYNFAFSDLHAALGLGQIAKLAKIIERKNEIREYYISNLSSIYPQIVFPKIVQDSRPVHWFSSILVDDAENLGNYLLTKNIQTRKFFYPLHRQPCFKDSPLVINANAEFSVSENCYRKGLSLPSWYELSDSQLNRVANEILRYYENRN